MKYVHAFEEGSKEQKYLLGGKGANLAEMTKLGLPVPPGFTISTDACKAYMGANDELPRGLMDEVVSALGDLEQKMGKQLGDDADPLLVSVRSGAPFSMPGMMDTVLNLGLNDTSVGGLAKQTDNERFAYDSYRRFVQMFGKIVLDISGERFEEALTELREARGVATDPELSAVDLRRARRDVQGHRAGRRRHRVPPGPARAAALRDRGCLQVVERAPRARLPPARGDPRRPRHGRERPDDGVRQQGRRLGHRRRLHARPRDGERAPYGDFLRNAQGEDVVAGIRVTEPLDAMTDQFPDCHRDLMGVMQTLETHYRDMCDIEFTIEQGRLFILQTRVGKRAATAALRMAVEMEQEGMIDRKEAVLRVQPEQLDQLLHPQFDPAAEYEAIAKGLNASPGAAVGKVYFTADDAEAHHADGEAVILVRPETSPDDLHGMIAAEGILTSRGGLVSHAAVVARGMGKPAVCGASALDISVDERTLTVDGTVVREGDVLSINGTTGEVVVGPVPVVTPEPGGPFEVVLGWADEYRRLGVRTNADLPHDAEVGRRFGAEGIGLCRTEHMFLGDRLPLVQRFILAADEAEEHAALAELGKLQRADFVGILEAMDGLPVTIRLLDPPLHEFLPDVEELLVKDAAG